MIQQVYRRQRAGIGQQRLLEIGKRLLPPVLFFAVAASIDLSTGQRYSSVLGSTAIVLSLVTFFPARFAALSALGGYAGIWVTFNLARAAADNTGFALGHRDLVADAEARVFGDLPSHWLQSRFFEPGQIDAADIAFSVVHGSFFVTPFVVGVVLWWKRRSLFRRYMRATAICLGIGLIGFLLLPTAPPWMSRPDEVTRVTSHLLAGRSGLGLGGSSQAFGFDPNHLAAMPSIHVAAVVLVFLAGRSFGRGLAALGGIYALAMTFSVVYLGEHYFFDAAFGWLVAWGAWRLAPRGSALGVPRAD